MRLVPTLSTLLLLLPGAAFAQGGFNVAWNECGASGVFARSFACDTNVGHDLLVVSFAYYEDLPQVVGLELDLNARIAGGTIPAWWDFRSGIGCRSGGLVLSTDFSSLGACSDPWGGALSGIIFQWVHGYGGFPDRLRVRAAAAVAEPVTIAGGVEHYAAAFQLRRGGTTGAGACAGCDLGACLSVGSLTLVRPAGVGDLHLVSPYDHALVFWQEEGAWHLCSTPARNRTWGQLKSLYR